MIIVKKSNNIPTILLITTLITIILTTVILAMNKNSNNNTDTNELKGQIHIFLYNRATIMISDQNIIEKEITLTSELSEKEKQLRYKIAQHRETLKKINETYLDVSTDIEILDTDNIGNNKVSIKVKETTLLTNKQKGIETGYETEHKLILQKNQADQWIIVEARNLEPIGLLPLQEMD